MSIIVDIGERTEVTLLTKDKYCEENILVKVSSKTAEKVLLQEKTVTPTEHEQSVVADDGYGGLSKLTVKAMPVTVQAVPSISVDSNGLITASAAQSAGYVQAGTKAATKQMAVQAAKEITPAASSQTAVTAGTYVTGDVVVKGEPNLKPENIKKNEILFGILGTHEGGEDLDAVIAEQEELLDELSAVLEKKVGSAADDGRIYLFKDTYLPVEDDSGTMMEPVPEEGVTYHAIVTLDGGGEIVEFESTCMDRYLGFGDGDQIDFAYEDGRGWFMWDIGVSYSVCIYYYPN